MATSACREKSNGFSERAAALVAVYVLGISSVSSWILLEEINFDVQKKVWSMRGAAAARYR